MAVNPGKMRGIIIGATIVVFLGVLFWAAKFLPRHRARKPSIVLISLDTVRPDHLGCHGYAVRATSPNLDRFAGSAALFLNARCQAPWTLPSHMSLFTSMLPSHNRVEDISQKLAVDVAYLPELLKKDGYRTVALVNDGQMKAHWGFARGFDTWEEFEADTPAGMAENITGQALRILAEEKGRPLFLFLHYYDAHDPYDPPSPFRERFGVTKSGKELRELAWEYRRPEKSFPDPAMIEQLRAAYDAEIAYLDDQLGRLLDAIPRDALVVFFSDHGEAFKEHGWTLHGAELFEEEIRSVLMIRAPGGIIGRRITDPVMLLDVAPTILKYAGITKPAAFEGIELQAALDGWHLPARLHFAETKRMLEGRILKSVMAPPAKLICNLTDGAMGLYALPDELNRLPVTHAPPGMVEAAREWLDGEQYWLVHLKGGGRREISAQFQRGRIAAFVPVGLNLETEEIEVAPDGKKLKWTCYLGDVGKRLFLQSEHADAIPELEVRRDDAALETNISWRVAGGRWSRDPAAAMNLSNSAAAPGEQSAAGIPEQAGVYIERNGTGRKSPQPAATAKLDDKTVRQLRSLGYLQ